MRLWHKTYLSVDLEQEKMSRLVTKPTKWSVRRAKTQISLGIRPVWSESSLCAQWVAKDPSFLHGNSEDSIRLGGCPGWIESSLGPHAILFVLSRGSSNGFSALRAWFCHVCVRKINDHASIINRFYLLYLQIGQVHFSLAWCTFIFLFQFW